jgi:hypothetical protein
LLNDDNEDDLALKVLIDNLGMEMEIPHSRGFGGSRPRRRAKIDRECQFG